MRLHKVQYNEYLRYEFWCPGCKRLHVFYIQGEVLSWTFNGDEENPTFEPCLLNTSDIVCHLYVRNGQIMFLSDCTHALAGQTIELQDIPLSSYK